MGDVVVVGGGPAGLMAADVIASAGHRVSIVDRMPSFGRKLLMAGRGGLNLTHSEPFELFLTRYGDAEERLAPAIRAFPPDALRAFVADLGEETFVGTSGRVFPKSFKASPMLRGWAKRLGAMGVVSRTRMRWTGFSDDRPVFRDAAGAPSAPSADAVVLALGGASWPKLGSDGSWTDVLGRLGVAVTPLVPANCGFDVAWSQIFRERFEGAPLKRIAVTFDGVTTTGEATVGRDGIEGGAIYPLTAALRAALATGGPATITIDLRPGVAVEELERALSHVRSGDSISNVLRKGGGLAPVAASLLREGTGGPLPSDAGALARLIKAVPIRLVAARPIDRAISSAGGIRFDEIGDDFMLKRLPGVFVCGEMLDWEAPTGGYLLQACFSTGRAAGAGVVARLEKGGRIRLPRVL